METELLFPSIGKLHAMAKSSAKQEKRFTSQMRQDYGRRLGAAEAGIGDLSIPQWARTAYLFA